VLETYPILTKDVSRGNAPGPFPEIVSIISTRQLAIY
jgi:hypothetical protein